ncbi:MAG: MBL fold metallo-hydrolase [Gemmatimonadaceae bacterium]|nr:MBL fold metallo-hydrolase [Gemmatimonadaceae bacterium]
MTFPTPLLQTRMLGDMRIHAIQAGGQRLDGGAMFGVVPKVLWQRKIVPDDRNRIQMGMRCLLVEHPDGLVLLDTGAGNKEDQKFIDIYGMELQADVPEQRADETALEAGIRAAGFTPDDVTLVINTHLHFDHAGGNTRREADGSVVPTFRNATYVVQHGEYEWATHTNERTAASYFPPNFEPVKAAGRLQLIDGDVEIVRGIRALKTPGHVPHHQSLVLESNGCRACFLGDVIPTANHVPLAWIMGYDVEPLRTLESKRALLRDAAAEDWLLVFEHDATSAWGTVAPDTKGYTYREG